MSEWLLIRPATPADAAVLVELGRAVASEPEGWMTYGRRATDERRNLRALRRDPHAAVFVAETEEGVVGRLSVSRDSHPASHHVAEFGLMVGEGHRRRGIGTALIEEAVKWARSAGVTKLELHVFPHNEPALELYEKLGFRKEGYRRRHYRRGEEYVDAVLMALDVQ